MALSLSGCAAVVNEIAGEDVAAIGRGHHFAERRCAACHSIDSQGTSPRVEAPSFGRIHQTYMPGSLIWELEASSSVGHYGMPATPTTGQERRDLVAYVQSLRPRAPAE
jgi:mono/diheme cytochrome c family protein